MNPGFSSEKPLRLTTTPFLGDILLSKNLISRQVLEEALAEQRNTGQRLGTILVRMQRIRPEELHAALQEQVGIPMVDLDKITPEPAALKLLPVDVVRRYQVIPYQIEEGKLYVATPDPMNIVGLDSLRFYVKDLRIEVKGCNQSDFNRFVTRHLDAKSVMDEILERSDFYKQTITVIETDEPKSFLSQEDREAAEESQQSPIIAFCNYLITEALSRRASDIHIEPTETAAQVRFRIDGLLQVFLNFPRAVVNPVVVRFKILSNLNIAKHLIPQDGHFNIMFRGQVVHFRVSTLPTAFGEKVVIRVLQNDIQLMNLEALGLENRDLGILKKALAQPQGLILVTGPTGSGKTTTIHAGLAHINHPHLNIVTLEDPVEATIPGINHVGIHPYSGLTFAQVLRSILRQDPDVVFVGEVRDEEVATIAMRAALTGHLVLSTVHTNSAIETVIRMDDLGVPPYILSSALLLVISQRLVRQVCPHCAKPYVPSADELAVLELDESVTIGGHFQKGMGCAQCSGSGYLGRTAVYEFMPVNREIRAMIRARKSPEEIFEAAREQGMITMMESGILKMRRGITTPEELARVLYRDVYTSS